MSEVDRLYVVFDADGKPYVKGLREIESQTKASGRTLESTFRTAGKAAGMAIAAVLVVGTAAIAGIGKASVKAAASFEYEMARVKAVANATGAEMAGMSKLALQLGKDTVFSAGEAAKGIYALATAGVSVADIMGGAAAAALDLAAAGELDVGRSAEIAAAAMNIFELKGKDVVAVADALAVGATKSAVEVSDMADAFNMSAAVAAQAGMSAQELTAAIALLGNAGIRGSDAGTSLKTMLMMLMAPTEQAADAMEQYGIEIYTASGEMKSLDEIIAELDQSLAGLSQEEANHVKRVVAGQDAIRALNVLTKVGADNYRDMTREVSRSGAAQDIAATKMDNLKGSYEQLKGSIETALIAIGTEGIPGLREVVDALTEETNRFLDAWERMTSSDAWRKGSYEIKMSMTADMVFDTLEDLSGKFGDWLRGVDWGVVGETLVRTLVRIAADAAKLAVEDLLPSVVQLGAGIIEGTVRDFFRVAKEAWREQHGAGSMPEWGYRAYFTEELETARAEQSAAALRALGDEEDRAFVRAQRQEAANRQVADSHEERAKAAENLADIEAALAAMTERLTKYTETLSGVYEGMVDPASIWNDAKGSLKSYIAEMDKALESWASFGDNLVKLAEQFGPEYGSEVIMKAAEIGPGFVAALTASDDPAMVRKALDGLEAYLGQSLEALANEVDTICEPYNVAMVKSITSALDDMDLTEQGRKARQEWNRGFEGGGTPSMNIPGSGVLTPNMGGAPVRLYDSGGDLPPGLTLALNATGRTESVVTGDLTDAIRDLVAHVKASLENDQALGDALLAAFGARSSLAGSYISRESARYSMYEAQGAPLEVLERVLGDQLRFIEEAVLEAEAQLEAAKASHLPQEEVNRLAESLFGLKESAADARRELEQLGRVPLERALTAWVNQLSQVDALLEIAGGSNSDLLSRQLGGMGGQYQSYLDLMAASSSPDDIMRYGQGAITTLVGMFRVERAELTKALDGVTDTVRAEQTAWTRAWDDRTVAVNDAHRAQLDALAEQERATAEMFDAQLRAIDNQMSALRERWADEDRALAEGRIERDLANLLAQGFYTEEDVRRIEDLRERQADMQRQTARDAEMKALEDQRAQIAEQQRLAMEQLDAKRESLEEQYQLQVEALRKEREAMERSFEERITRAEAQYDAELEALRGKYAGMTEEVIAQEQTLLAEAPNYHNAGLALGEAFAAGLLASIGSIQAAAQAMAQAASDHLELHSPAKKGPLAHLDEWWRAFPETLLKPLEIPRAIDTAMLSSIGGGGYFDVSRLISGGATGMPSDASGSLSQYLHGQALGRAANAAYYDWLNDMSNAGNLNWEDARWVENLKAAYPNATTIALDRYELDPVTGLGSFYWQVWDTDQPGKTIIEKQVIQFQPSSGAYYSYQYDSGGWLMPGSTWATNATGKPELILPYEDLLSGKWVDTRGVHDVPNVGGRGMMDPYETVHVFDLRLSGDEANDRHLPELARLVAREINADLDNLKVSFGRR